jgi:hypothetical protein
MLRITMGGRPEYLPVSNSTEIQGPHVPERQPYTAAWNMVHLALTSQVVPRTLY